MSTDDHNRWGEELAAYALAALEPGEVAEFERHLAGCERCQAELRWLAPAVAVLPEAVERKEPPRRLRENLMAEVRADARRAEGGSPARERRNLLPGWLRGGRLRLATGFAVVLLAVAAVAGYEIGKGGSGGGGRATTVVSHQPDGVTAAMVREGEGGTLKLTGVHQLPPGKVLEAWVRREGTVEPTPSLFAPDRKGHASTTIADMSGVDTVMVTEEPQGGSKEPTSEPIATMSVPQ
jgi:hypothetical protein